MQTLFTKADMEYDAGYTWSEVRGTHPDVIGNLYSGRFNRLEGDDVLAVINSCMQRMGKYSVGEGRKLERMIKHALPCTIKCHQEVYDWLLKHYRLIMI